MCRNYAMGWKSRAVGWTLCKSTGLKYSALSLTPTIWAPHRIQMSFAIIASNSTSSSGTRKRSAQSVSEFTAAVLHPTAPVPAHPTPAHAHAPLTLAQHHTGPTHPSAPTHHTVAVDHICPVRRSRGLVFVPLPGIWPQVTMPGRRTTEKPAGA